MVLTYFLSIVSFLAYLYMGVYVLRLERGSLSNRLFFVICFFFCYWAVTEALMIASPDSESALVWVRFSALGWTILPGFLLHFFLLLSERQSLLHKRWIYPVLYSPSLLFAYYFFSKTGAESFRLVNTGLGYNWQWCYPTESSTIWSIAYILFFQLYILIGLLSVWQWGKTSGKVRHQKQARLITFSVFITMVLIVIIYMVIPLFGEIKNPPLTLTTILIPILCIWYSIKKYQLLILTPASFTSDILKMMGEGFLFADTSAVIRMCNSAAEHTLRYQPDELIGKPLSLLLRKNNIVEKRLERGDSRPIAPFEINLFTKTGDVIPALLAASPMRDSFGDLFGFIYTFSNISKLKEAQNLLLSAYDDLELRIAERTQELSSLNQSLQEEIGERKRIEKRISHLAYHDYLTELPNRLMLTECLNNAIVKARRTGKLFAVLFIDLDHFKTVNDSMGHSQGDKLLKEVAQRLSDLICKDDTLARVGGDEFVIVARDFDSTAYIETYVTGLLDSFNEPFKLREQEFYVTASIGISLYPGDGDDTELLIRNADIATYKAKETGRNKYIFCTSPLKQKIHETSQLTSCLYHALERGEFFLCYQPQVHPGSGQIIGLEALLRWKHPSRGVISPKDFIPIAESTGLILPIGEWVLHTACAQNKAWQDAGLPKLRVAVNLSLHQFHNPHLYEQVVRVLGATGLGADCLELEITESAVMKETAYIIDILNSFRALGITISIDDFGTEYSSLNYLKHLPVDRIKIAMPFIQGIAVSDKDEAITKAIIVLAKSLGMGVIAEGVETAQQLSFLSQSMCDEIQGFYYYRPMPAAETEELLRTIINTQQSVQITFS